MQEQVAKGIHLQQNCTISQPVCELLEKMDKATPKHLSRFFFNCMYAHARGVCHWSGDAR